MLKSKKSLSNEQNAIALNDTYEYYDAFYSLLEKAEQDINADKEKNRRLSWNEMYMMIAQIVARRSKDPHTKVGAVLVKDNRILGIGYNAEPKNFKLDFDWHSSEKYDFVIHAELNAIANSTYFGNSIEGSDMYLTLSPCHECMKLIIQYQIKRIFYHTKYKDFAFVKKMAEHSGIELIEL